MRAAGRLAHPNIVAAHDAGRVGGTYFLAMDFVDGADLSALVGRLGPLSVPDACELVRQAAVGLQHACECGLTHRDLNPPHRMLAKDPADRPATPGEVADALGPFAGGADPAGLLTRVGSSAPAPRPAPPDTLPTVDGRNRGLRRAAFRYTLAAGAGALAALLAAAPFLGAGRGRTPDSPW